MLMHNKNEERLERLKNEEKFSREKDTLNKQLESSTEKFDLI